MNRQKIFLNFHVHFLFVSLLAKYMASKSLLFTIIPASGSCVRWILEHSLACVKYLNKCLHPANKNSESEMMILVLFVMGEEKENEMPPLWLCHSCVLLCTLYALPRQPREGNVSRVLWNISVMATVIHTLICLGSLASMMDCDCFTLQKVLSRLPSEG